MEIKYVTYAQAVEYFGGGTVIERVKAKSRFFDKVMCRETVEDLIKFVKTTKLPEGARLTIGFQQLQGKAEGAIPWRNATYWLNWALRWQNSDGIKIDLKLLEKSYLKTINDPAATPYSY